MEQSIVCLVSNSIQNSYLTNKSSSKRGQCATYPRWISVDRVRKIWEESFIKINECRQQVWYYLAPSSWKSWELITRFSSDFINNLIKESHPPTIHTLIEVANIFFYFVKSVRIPRKTCIEGCSHWEQFTPIKCNKFCFPIETGLR